MTDKIKVALIGCGRIGFDWDQSSAGSEREAYSHFAAINNSDQFELVAVADPDSKNLSKLRNYDSFQCEVSWQTVLKKNKNLDLVVIASPDETHASILLEIADFNPRCVFVEKPLSLGFRTCEEIVQRFEEKGISLLVNYSRRFMSEYRELKREIDEGVMGKALCLTIHYTGGFAHNGVHFLDLIHWFFGHPERTTILNEESNEQKGELPQSPTTIHFSYESGLAVNLIGIGNESPAHHQIEFIASSGGFRILNNESIERYKVVQMERFEGFSQFSPARCERIESGLALPHAYSEIAEHLTKQTLLKRTPESCLTINCLIEKEKTK
ncbi:Gfo/Idh/MocA family oxidoreductase [Verrucomicrobia bacterium]|nr:Gfo/Idh/MocA family oxidoreductase [Verrucomicrobiota bacterium]